MAVIAKELISDANLILFSGLMLLGAAAYKISDLFDEPGREVSEISRSKIETAAVSTTKTAPPRTTAVLERSTEPAFLLLDINAATAEELTQLKGIGEHIAAEIVKYRISSGGFKNIEEIMNVSGIGEATFNDISSHIYVIDPVYEPATTEAVTVVTEPEQYIEPEEPTYTVTLEDVAPIDLNTADAEMLTLLPHVSDEAAAEIVELREKLGSFSSYYELLYVSSLSEKDVSEIRDYVTVEKIDE